MLSDVRNAIRSLRKSPGFTVIAALTLALGMGANTTFFSVLYGVVLKSLPFPRSSELVEVRNLGERFGSNDGRISLPELLDIRERQHSLVGVGAYSIGRVTLSLDDGAERIVQVRITSNVLALLGLEPATGRGFTEADERPGAGDRAIIVSHGFWQSQLGGTSQVIGKSVRLNGVEHTVIGVMPANFAFGERGTAIWAPLELSTPSPADRNDRTLSTLARLAPDFSLNKARADLQRVAQQIQSDLPDAYPANGQWGIGLTPLRESQFGHFLSSLGTLMAAAAAVLLIGCVNVAIMFLLRAAARRRELMIRLALGAGRSHIIRQLLAESAVVCGLGTAGGLLLALGGLSLIKAFPPSDIPRLEEVSINGPVALFTAGAMVLVTLVVGLAPAIAVLKTKVSEGITQTGRATETRSAVKLRDALTVVEIALAVMLLVCGGLAVRSLQSLLHEDVGFATTQLITFKTNLTERAYPDLARANAFYDQLTSKLEALPGVSAVAAISYLPLSGESQFAVVAPVSQSAATDAHLPVAAWRVVRGHYFSTMGSTLLQGRFFESSDQANTSLVAIVDDAFARRFWPDESAAIGQAVRFGEGASAQTRTIIGVVRHVKHLGPGRESLPEAYVPQSQFYQRGMYTVLKTSTASTALAPLVRARLAEVDPGVPMYFMETMESRYANALAMPRFTAGLIGAFSTLALILAGVGIFGVTAYSVAQRSREFGIRLALGAQRSHITGLVLGRVGKLALFGGAIGAVAAYGAAQLMTGVLFGIEAADTPTLAITAAITAFAALIASLAPLTRALRVNPAESLRSE